MLTCKIVASLAIKRAFLLALMLTWGPTGVGQRGVKLQAFTQIANY
jgi:hypothetical protein